MSEFWSRFDAVPAGPMTTANKQLAFPGRVMSNELDPNGNFFSVVAAQGVYGGNCMRMHYPVGAFGAGTQQFQFGIGAKSAVVNLELDFLFETGFDFPAGGTGGGGAQGGKMGPRLFWGGVTTGIGIRAKWEAPLGGNPEHFDLYCDRLSDGAVVGVNPVGPIATNRWFHFKFQLYGGGAASWGKIWIDGVLTLDTGNLPWNVTNLTDSVTVDFSSFFGGGNFASAPTVDSYARVDRIHVWSGTGPGSSYPYYDQPSV